MTGLERATRLVLDAAVRANEHVFSVGGPDGRIFVDTGPFEDLDNALDAWRDAGGLTSQETEDVTSCR